MCHAQEMDVLKLLVQPILGCGLLGRAALEASASEVLQFGGADRVVRKFHEYFVKVEFLPICQHESE